MRRQAGWLAGILLLTVALYARVSSAPLLSYDDFLEVHRAAFEDDREPARVFTTPHFDTFKYRPFNRALNLLSYRIGHGSALAFRWRNLGFHLVNVLLVARLGSRLLKSAAAGTLAAALFAVHPMTNQTVIGSVMTNTAAHACMLAALACWLQALDEPDASAALPALGIVFAGISLFFYDSAITFYPTVLLYAAILVWRHGRRAIPPRHALVFALGSLLVLGLYFGLRARFVPGGFGAAAADRAGPAGIARNVAVDATAMLAPIDPVLGNAWWHAPLPSELSQAPGGAGVIAVLALAALVVGFLLVLGWWPRRDAPGPGAGIAWFLVGAIGLSLAPVLLLTTHASETYVYLPMAFLSVLGAGALMRLAERRRALATAIVAVLLVHASLATAVRNERVRGAAFTARRILDGLPASLARGSWHVALADVPGETPSVRYGFYGFHGTGTIGAPPHADRALSCALELRFGNASITGRVLDARALTAACAGGARSDEVLARVHADGRVDPCEPGASAHD